MWLFFGIIGTWQTHIETFMTLRRLPNHRYPLGKCQINLSSAPINETFICSSQNICQHHIYWKIDEGKSNNLWCLKYPIKRIAVVSATSYDSAHYLKRFGFVFQQRYR
eukprot:234496_1